MNVFLLRSGIFKLIIENISSFIHCAAMLKKLGEQYFDVYSVIM